MTQKFKGTATGSTNFGGPFIPSRAVTADASGKLNSISWTISNIFTTVDIMACLWADSGSSSPGQLKDWGTKTSYSTTGDKTQSLTQAFPLVNGVTYWIGFAYSCGNGQIELPQDSVNTYSSTTYERPSGNAPTDVRDSPVLNYVVATGGGSWVALGASMMIWADQSTATATTSQMTAGSYTLTGKSTHVGRGFKFAAGSYTLTGKSISKILGHAAALATGVYVLTGKTISPTKHLIRAMATGAYTLTGQTVRLVRNWTARVTSGVYRLTPGWHSIRLDSTATTTNRKVNRKWWASLLNGRN